ncbi:unnamed protein product [Blepharisma stoltei]|uniref:Peptidase A1 domain-containing protein n=1 Tax=Blepharisma stoltei TaxID=1481888 RepID=A0AAU9J1W0_9CILI|nr:unnamed protein product [Blepharisma stoltei]
MNIKFIIMSVLAVFLFQIVLGNNVRINKEPWNTYITKIAIGGINYDLQLSIGTSLTMVISRECAHCEEHRNPYNLDSSTFGVITVNSEQCWSTDVYESNECGFLYEGFDEYEAKGALSLETIRVGMFSMSEVIFGRIFHENQKLNIDGIFGIGQHNLKRNYGPSLLDLLVANEHIRDVFSFCMTSEKDKEGFLTFGGFDSEYYHISDFKLFPIDYNDRYSIPVISIFLNNSEFWNGEIEGILETRIPYILLPEKLFSHFIASLSAYYGTDCDPLLCTKTNNTFYGNSIPSTPAKFPKLTFTLSNKSTLKIDINEIFMKCLNSNDYCSIIKFFPEDYIVLGAPVLEKFYVTIDTESRLIGLAEVSACAQPLILSRFSTWEDSSWASSFKLTMILTAIGMIAVIIWYCGKSYELEYEIIHADDE